MGPVRGGPAKGCVMVVATESASLALNVQLPGREFVEGSVIDVVVHGVAGRDVTLAGREVALIRTVTYQYRFVSAYGGFSTASDRNAEVVTRQSLPAGGRLSAGQQFLESVALAVPGDGPGSVTAALLRIEWMVRARLQVEGSSDIEVTRHIRVLSRAAGRASVEGSAPLVVDRGCAVLALDSLSSRRLVPGSSLVGVLTVTAKRPVSARGVRVELVLRELVHHGPWIGDDPAHNPAYQDKEKDTPVASALVAVYFELEPTHPLRFPFTLSVPDNLAAPSVQTPEVTLSWVLRGVLDRARRPDPYVELELRGVTTAD